MENNKEHGKGIAMCCSAVEVKEATPWQISRYDRATAREIPERRGVPSSDLSPCSRSHIPSFSVLSTYKVVRKFVGASFLDVCRFSYLLAGQPDPFSCFDFNLFEKSKPLVNGYIRDLLDPVLDSNTAGLAGCSLRFRRCS
ncbi:MAG: hypothetical protein QW515_04350 [Thermoplasmatales archaeon]